MIDLSNREVVSSNEFMIPDTDLRYLVETLSPVENESQIAYYRVKLANKHVDTIKLHGSRYSLLNDSPFSSIRFTNLRVACLYVCYKHLATDVLHNGSFVVNPGTIY